MKFHELFNNAINEAKIDDLLEKANLNTIFRYDIKKVNSGLINKSKYAEWLIRGFKHEGLAEIMPNDIIEALNYFEKNQSRFEKKDIFKYTYNALINEIEQLKTTPTKSERSLKASADAPKVFENDKCTIFNILSENAAKKYGKSTKWCISAEKNNQWNYYVIKQEYTFYFLIDKKTFDKYAFAVNESMGMECFNTADERTDPKFVIDVYDVKVEILKPRESTIDDKLDEAIGKNGWKRNENGTIDAFQGVQVSHKLVENGRLIVKFGVVTGEFNCSMLDLTTLEGCPKKITSNFSCYDNHLTNLYGGPEEVGITYNCSVNWLTSLEGLPKVLRNLICSGNDIENLEGCPERIRYLDCAVCENLTFLKGAPKYVDTLFDCRSCNLTNLIGAPEEVTGSFNCKNNKLTSLEGAPKKAGYFDCSWNSKNFTKKDVQDVCEVTQLIFT